MVVHWLRSTAWGLQKNDFPAGAWREITVSLPKGDFERVLWLPEPQKSSSTSSE